VCYIEYLIELDINIVSTSMINKKLVTLENYSFSIMILHFYEQKHYYLLHI